MRLGFYGLAEFPTPGTPLLGPCLFELQALYTRPTKVMACQNVKPLSFLALHNGALGRGECPMTCLPSR